MLFLNQKPNLPTVFDGQVGLSDPQDGLSLKLTSSSRSVQFSCSVVTDFVTPWTAAHQASLSFTNSWSLPKLMSIESVMPSNHLILSSPSPPAFNLSQVFSKESVLCIRWPKYWSFSFKISPFNEHPGLIFRMDWLDLLAVQGTLKGLLQTTVRKHQFVSAQLPLSNSHIHM